MASESRAVFRTASVLFVLSGATSLAYEIIWFKRFSQAWGQSYLAVALVTAAFLCGLGVGAWLLGRWADRTRVPLIGYAICEALIGVMALGITWAVEALRELPPDLLASFQDRELSKYLFRFALTLAILGPPTFLMGGTLPLLVRQFAGSNASMRQGIGWFYFLNTLGAALGTYVAGFHLLPALGLVTSNYIIAAINIAIAGIALLVARRLPGTPQAVFGEDAPPPPAAAADPVPVPDPAMAPMGASAGPRGAVRAWRVTLAAFLAGMAALALQLVWTRQLILAVGSSTYAFTAVLTVVLLGLAIGSLAFRVWARRERDLYRAVIYTTFGIAFFTLLGKTMLPQITYWSGHMRDFRGSQVINALFCTGVSMVLELGAAVGMGFLFPLMVLHTRRNCAEAGRAIGQVYAWNTLGTVLGALATGALLVAKIGTLNTMVVALGLYLLMNFVLVWPAGPSHRRSVWLFTLPFLAVMGLTAVPQNEKLLNYGFYLYGYSDPELIRLDGPPRFFREGSSTNVMVLESTYEGGVVNRTLRVNGKVDGSSEFDQPTQLGSAYIPRIFNPGAREVLVIGFGTGGTSGASTLFPGTQVVCAEIEQAVFDASYLFNRTNHAPERRENFEMVIDDGRNYMQSTTRMFDIIISEPSNPWISGIANLFTVEFYQEAKRHLNPGGILVQWIQQYQLAPEDYALIARTVRREFPHSLLIQTRQGDTLLLACEHDPLADLPRTIAAAQRLFDTIPETRFDLKYYFQGLIDLRILVLKMLMLDDEGLDRLDKFDPSGQVNTDRNLTLEFRAPLRLYRADDAGAKIERAVGSVFDANAYVTLFERLGLGFEHVPLLWDRVRTMRVLAPERATELEAIIRQKYPNAEEPEHLSVRQYVRETDTHGLAWADGKSSPTTIR